MAKNKKKNKKKQDSPVPAELDAQVERLRRQNEALRARLEKIRELTHELPLDDEEDDEYEEMRVDVDDQIAADKAARKTADDGSDGAG
jgi:hypothetical protein